MRNLRGLASSLFVLLTFTGLAAPAQGGSAQLLLDIQSGEAFRSRSEAEVQGSFLPLGPVALVPIFEPASGRELWVTDGTEVGTRPLLDLCPGSCSSFFAPLGATRQVGIFLAHPESDSNPRVWRSDGTRPGTFPLAPSPGGDLRSCGGAAAVGSALLFAARAAGEDCALWRTDGSSAGTLKLWQGTPSALTSAGGLAFFETFDARNGPALWRTDGTAEGTIQLRLWQQGSPRDFAAVGSRLFFTAPEDGRELWTSDGTVAGTQPLTRFGPAEPFVSRSDFSSGIVLQDAGGSACFLANDGSSGRELWCSDGTPAGTRQVTSLVAASPFVGLANWRVERIGSRLLFPANDGVSGNRWWTSDGRPQSTAPLSGCPGGCPVVDPESRLVRVGGQVFFAARGEGPVDPEEPPTTDLWVTDGSGSGTRRVGDFCASCRVDRMFPLLGKLFFSAGNPPFSFDLWASDGTSQGTRLLLAVDGFAEDVLPFAPIVVNGRGLLAQSDSIVEGPGLWVSDGTPAGTEEVAFLGRNTLSSQPHELVPDPQGVRFLAFNEEGLRIWQSGGTADTTAAIATTVPAEELTAFGNITFINSIGNDPLWRTDGTPAGTFPLTPAGLEPGRPVVLGNLAVFVARTPGESTASLWATDGTLAGTRKIADLPTASVDITPAGAWALVAIFDNGKYILWRTDGTSAGTREIPLPEDFRIYNRGDVAQLGSTLFFRGYSNSGDKLWRSDGTPGGTRPLADGILGSPGSFAVHAGSLYVLAHTAGPASHESGLFRSDGTEAGTVLLATVPRSTTAVPERAELTSVGGLLFFVLEEEKGRGRELWRSDGTPAGTFLVRDIVPGPESSEPRYLTALGDRLYFTASSLGSGTELWQSDGTEGGTRIVQDIAPGALSSSPHELVAGGGRLFFVADDGVHGLEPWVYTPGGEGCVASDAVLCLGGGRFKVEADWRDFAGRRGRGHAVSLTPDTGYFWFFGAANVEVILKVLDGQGLNGHHWVFYGALSNVEYTLTVTDTESGAVRRYFNPAGRLGSVADTQAFGPLGASTSSLVTAGPGPVAGEGLAVARAAAATGSCEPRPTRLCLNGGRFAVEARWRDFQGNTGTGQAVPLPGGDTGYFWFFDAANVEVVLKVLDGRPLNGKFWVFYGALSNVEYTLTVTDTATGAVKTYTNPSGRLASVADAAAF